MSLEFLVWSCEFGVLQSAEGLREVSCEFGILKKIIGLQ